MNSEEKHTLEEIANFVAVENWESFDVTPGHNAPIEPAIGWYLQGFLACFLWLQRTANDGPNITQEDKQEIVEIADEYIEVVYQEYYR